MSDHKFYAKVAEILHLSIDAVKTSHTKQPGNNMEIKARIYKYNVDSFDRNLIKNVLHSFYRERQLPTAGMIMEKISSEIVINMTILYRTLKELGFCWRKTTDVRRVAIERNETVTARAKYLRDIDIARNSGQNIIYLDETWINKNHCRGYAWLSQLQDLGIDADRELCNEFYFIIFHMRNINIVI